MHVRSIAPQVFRNSGHTFVSGASALPLRMCDAGLLPLRSELETTFVARVSPATQALAVLRWFTWWEAPPGIIPLHVKLIDPNHCVTKRRPPCSLLLPSAPLAAAIAATPALAVASPQTPATTPYPPFATPSPPPPSPSPPSPPAPPSPSPPPPSPPPPPINLPDCFTGYSQGTQYQ